MPTPVFVDPLERLRVTLRCALFGAIGGGAVAVLGPTPSFIVSSIAGLLGGFLGLALAAGADLLRLVHSPENGATGFYLFSLTALLLAVGVGGGVMIRMAFLESSLFIQRLEPIVAAAIAAGVMAHGSQFSR